MSVGIVTLWVVRHLYFEAIHHARYGGQMSEQGYDEDSPQFVNIDNKMVQTLVRGIGRMIDAMCSEQMPGIPRKAEWFEVYAALNAVTTLWRKQLARKGVEVHMVAMAKDTTTCEETPVLNNTSHMLYDWFDSAHHKLISEIQAAKSANGGDVPLSMWEVQRMIGKVELLDELKERIVR